MDRGRGRRKFMKSMLGAVVAPYALGSTKAAHASAPAESPGPRVHLQPLDYRGRRVLESRWLKQYQAARDLFYKLPDDNLLKGFRERAGLPAPGVSLGGWYGQDAFNIFPQWLSGMARMSAAT